MTAEMRKQMALTELALKGKSLELSWFKKYFKKIYVDSGLLPSEVPRKAIVLYNELLKWEEEAKAAREKRLEKMKEDMLKPQERKWKPSVVTKWDLERGIMYPVEPEVKAVLYSGISHNDEGRRRYLHIRNLEEPCDRFYEPQACGMDYGWNIAERGFPPNKEFATAEVINSEFYRRNGVKGETLRNRPPINIPTILTETNIDVEMEQNDDGLWFTRIQKPLMPFWPIKIDDSSLLEIVQNNLKKGSTANPAILHNLVEFLESHGTELKNKIIT